MAAMIVQVGKRYLQNALGSDSSIACLSPFPEQLCNERRLGLVAFGPDFEALHSRQCLECHESIDGVLIDSDLARIDSLKDSVSDGSGKVICCTDSEEGHWPEDGLKLGFDSLAHENHVVEASRAIIRAPRHNMSPFFRLERDCGPGFTYGMCKYHCTDLDGNAIKPVRTEAEDFAMLSVNISYGFESVLLWSGCGGSLTSNSPVVVPCAGMVSQPCTVQESLF